MRGREMEERERGQESIGRARLMGAEKRGRKGSQKKENGSNLE